MRFAVVCGRFSALFALGCLPLWAQPADPPAEPDFDIRAETAIPAAAPGPQAVADYARAAFGAEGLRAKLSSTGSPRALYRLGSPLAEVSAEEPAAAAREFLADHASLFPAGGAALRQLETAAVRSRPGMSHVRLRQRVAGVSVWSGEVQVTLDGSGGIVQLLAGDLVAAEDLDSQPAIGDLEAVQAAALAAGLAAPARLEGRAGSSESWTFYAHPEGDKSDIALQLTVFPLSPSLPRLAYRIFIDGRGQSSYEMLIDAADGSLLFRNNVTWEVGQARVWTKSPIAGDRELLDFADGWLPPDGLVTTGNNADAFRDRDADDQPDEEEFPDSLGGRAFSATQVFDFEAGEGSTGQDPFDFPAAAITNFFYLMNVSHDYFYALGFDEQAGNFQADNFGRGGVGGDPIIAVVHRSLGAAFQLRPEGVSSRIRAGRGRNSTRTRTDDPDLAYDGQIAIHEYAHGLTTRILGGPDRTDCLVYSQGRALGEGWSDYYGISYTDDPVLGAYDGNDLEVGIRRQSYEGYSLTYQDTFNDGVLVHDGGEVWAAALWEVRKRLGKEATDQLVTDALWLTPCDPTPPDAKDAVILADQLMNAGANVATLYEVFARFGLGFSSSGSDGSNLVESLTFNAAFDLPPAPGGNRNPTVRGKILQLAVSGEELRYRIQASDPDGDTLAFAVLEGPPGLAVSAEGEVAWNVDRFARQRASIEITDGNGGRIVHGFTIPVVTRAIANEPIRLSAAPRDTVRVRFGAPAGEDLMQVTLRDPAGTDSRADLRVFPPGMASVISFRRGANETLTFASPERNIWTAWVTTLDDIEDVELLFSFPEAQTLEPNQRVEAIAGETSSETFYRLTIPEGVDSFTVSTGGGGGNLDLFMANGRYPICQGTPFITQRCDFDDFSLGFGNFEEISVNGEASLKGEVRVRADAGDYLINFSGEAAYQGVSATVTLDTGGGAPRVNLGGAVSAAGAAFFVSPGSIASVFGSGLASAEAEAGGAPLPRELASSRVFVNGMEAPLFFVSGGQVNLQVPFETLTTAPAALVVENNGVPSPIAFLAAVPNAPEVFTYNRTPADVDPVIIHADGSLVTPDSPARPGETIVIFATGLGLLDNPPATGEATPAAPLAQLTTPAVVAVGPGQAAIQFAGLTPGFVGLAQFNAVLSANLPTTPPVQPLGIIVGSALSAPVGLHVGP